MQPMKMYRYIAYSYETWKNNWTAKRVNDDWMVRQSTSRDRTRFEVFTININFTDHGEEIPSRKQCNKKKKNPLLLTLY